MKSSYLEYFKNGVRENGLSAPLTYGKRYLSTLHGYTTGTSKSGPIEGDLCITYNCNLRCEMCDLPYKHEEFHKQGRTPLTLSKYQRIIKDFRSIGTSAIAIAGGEPFVNKDLFDIIRCVKSERMICQVTTNGWFIRKQNVQEFLNTGINTVTVSIDGHTAELHDQIRGKHGSFDRAVQAISLLKKHKAPHQFISISTVLSPQNFQYVQEIINVAKLAGADSIGFMPVHDILDSETTVTNISEEELLKIRDGINKLCALKKEDSFIETSLDYLKLFKNFYQKEPLPMRCMAGYTTLLVDCYGDVFPCFTFFETKRSFGNINDTNGLANFWKSHQLKSERDKIRRCNECYWNCQVETNLLYKPFIYYPKRSTRNEPIARASKPVL